MITAFHELDTVVLVRDLPGIASHGMTEGRRAWLTPAHSGLHSV